MAGYESTYNYAKGLLQDARDYSETSVKATTLKKAWNAASLLPDYFPGKNELLSDIERYAYNCGIDLSKVSGY